jgi:hypothetical protein
MGQAHREGCQAGHVLIQVRKDISKDYLIQDLSFHFGAVKDFPHDLHL